MPVHLRYLFGAILLAGAACSSRAPAGEYDHSEYATSPGDAGRDRLHFAVHPLHNPARLLQSYQPLVDHLNARIPGAPLVLEASRDYAEFERKVAMRQVSVVLPNPWQTLEAMKAGYHVVATAGEAADFRGIFIVRRDAGIRSVADLRGRAVAYPAPTALAACLMPQWFLHERGLDVNRDIENLYVGSQESAIMNAYLRTAAAGATWPPPWRAFMRDHPQQAAALKVIWETPPLINNALMVRDDVPSAVRDRLRTLLLELDASPEGRAVLANMETARFLPADDTTYDIVRDFVARFEADVRPIKGS